MIINADTASFSISWFSARTKLYPGNTKMSSSDETLESK